MTTRLAVAALKFLLKQLDADDTITEVAGGSFEDALSQSAPEEVKHLAERLSKQLREKLSHELDPGEAEAAEAILLQGLKVVGSQIEQFIDLELDPSRIAQKVIENPETASLSSAAQGFLRTAAVEVVTHLLHSAAVLPGFQVGIARGVLKSNKTLAELCRQLSVAADHAELKPSHAAQALSIRRRTAYASRTLEGFEYLSYAGERLSLRREVTAAVIQAVQTDSLVIVGAPGSGKSGTLSAVARELVARNHPVITLSVDALPAATLADIDKALGLERPLAEVLEEWPGEPGFLIIDALDAARDGVSEAAYRALIEQIADRTHPWKVVCSIRAFDLRLGERYRRAFVGSPPDARFASKDFSNVRHVFVPPWTSAEMDQIFDKWPLLKKVVESGGDRLRDLVATPFNMQRMMDVVTSKPNAEGWADVSTRADLMRRYWEYRVDRHGIKGQVCLRSITNNMIQQRRLLMRIADLDPQQAATVDDLMRDGVLVERKDSGRNQVAFAHNVLFDYASGRLVVETEDVDTLYTQFSSELGQVMILAPALEFFLEGLWQDRGAFWRAVTSLCESVEVDPIAKAIAGRVAAELPSAASDIQPWIDAYEKNVLGRKGMLSGLVRVLVPLDSIASAGRLIGVPAWSRLAAALARHTDETAGLLRGLLALLLSHTSWQTHRDDLGLAARSLLKFAMDAPFYNAHLAGRAVAFVAKTAGTDLRAARKLISRIFDPSRLSTYGHGEAQSLAMDISNTIESSPVLAVDIYRQVFGHTVSSRDPVPITKPSDHLLRLSSTPHQNYQFAKHQLIEALPQFIASHQALAVHAVVLAVEAEEETPLSAATPLLRFEHAGHVYLIQPLGQRIWFDRFEDDSAEDLLDVLLDAIKKAPAEEIVGVLTRRCQSATTWRELLVAGAEAPEKLGILLVDLVLQGALLHCPETCDAARALLSAVYRMMPKDEQGELEQRFEAAKGLSEALIKEIREAPLVTPARRSGVVSFRDPTELAGSTTEFSALESKAVSLCGLKKEVPAIPQDGHAALLELNQALASSPNQDPTCPDRRQALHTLARCCGSLAELPAGQLATQQLETLIQIVEQILGFPPYETGSEISHSPRVYAVEAWLGLQRLHPSPDLEKSATRWLSDPEAGLRCGLASHLVMLHATNLDLMWRLLETFCKSESNERVAALALSRVFGPLVNHDPARSTPVLMVCADRFAGKGTADLGEVIGSLIGVLWWHGEAAAWERIRSWTVDPVRFRKELRGACGVVRNSLVPPSPEKENQKPGTHRRSIELIELVVESTADALEKYLESEEPSASEKENATRLAYLLEAAVNQLYFASGAFEHGQHKGLESRDDKRLFLDKVGAILRKAGAVATPTTINHIVELLEFLSEANPAFAFDLVAHCLLTGGQRHNYQADAIAAAAFPDLIGRFLADYRSIFSDSNRRIALVRCIELFHGWPRAAQLFYLLPELVE